MIACLFFCLLASGIVLLSGQSFGKVLPFSFILSTIIMYVSQLIFNTFTLGYVILYCMAGVSIVGIIYYHKRIDFKKDILYSGFIAIVVMFIFYLFMDFGRHFNTVDEMATWGKMVKEMIRTGHFYSVAESNLLGGEKKIYPPFFSLFEMIWCHLNGGFNEFDCTIALHVFSTSIIVLPLTEKIRDKNVISSIFYACILFLLFSLILYTFDIEMMVHTIYADYALAMLAAYSLIILINGKVTDSIFDFCCFVLAASGVLLSKQIGIAYFGLMIEYLVVRYVYIVVKKKSENIKKDSLLTGLCIAIPSCAYISWKVYCDNLKLGKGQFDLGQITISGIYDSLINTGIRHDTVNSFIVALYDTDISLGAIPVTFLSVTAVIALAIVFYRQYLSDRISVSKTLGIVLIMVTGILGYAFTMMILYMFCFSELEMSVLASYPRYMGSFAVFEIVVLLSLLVDALFCGNYTFKRRLLVGIVSIEIIVNPYVIVNYEPQIIQQKDIFAEERVWALTMNEKTDINSTIFVVDEYNDSQLVMNCFLDARIIDLRGRFTCKKNGYTEYSFENIKNGLMEDDYMYICSLGDNMKKTIGDIISCQEDLEEGCLYRLSYVSNEIVAKRVD